MVRAWKCYIVVIPWALVVCLMYGTYVAPTFHWVADTSRLMKVYQTLLRGALIMKVLTPLHEKYVWPRETSHISRMFRFAKRYQEGDLYCIMQRMSG